MAAKYEEYQASGIGKYRGVLQHPLCDSCSGLTHAPIAYKGRDLCGYCYHNATSPVCSATLETDSVELEPLPVDLSDFKSSEKASKLEEEFETVSDDVRASEDETPVEVRKPSASKKSKKRY